MKINYEKLLHRLNKIGIALSAERDVNKLLEIILSESMQITSSDGGSIYIKEEKDGVPSLRFTLAKNISRQIDFKEFHLVLDKKSIAGYVGMTGETLDIPNVNKIPKRLGLKYNPNFDKTINYKTVNMLVIPMKDYKKEVVGVLQLLNKKKSATTIFKDPSQIEENIKKYTKPEIEIISSLSSQAGILIERTRLYDEIQELLRSFIESMVTTLEARDNTSSGHSRRLAGYSVQFLEAVNKVNYGQYKDVCFTKDQVREIYYAALLHDIGKIGVKESVLLKADRLSKEKIKEIKYRYKYVKLKLETMSQKKQLNKTQLLVYQNIDEYLKLVINLNDKGFIETEIEEKLKQIKSIKLEFDKEEIELLTDFEYQNLSIKKGNLTSEERKEIESHVLHSYNILKGITWTKDLLDVPIIAGNHHEKINGTGYPNRLNGDEINTQAKILAILDIFEALTAIDRPYKKPMSVQEAIRILEFGVKDNHLDKDLFEIFITEKVFETYKEELNKIIRI